MVTYTIPGGAAAASEARAVVTGVLESQLDERRLEDVRLLVSELVTNGVLHGHADAGETLRLTIACDGKLRVDVIDPGDGFVPGAPRSEAVGGWGLMLVDELADRWGVTRNGSTHVWFELAV